MAARTFIWISTGGGAWSLAANWDDQTDGVDPSAIVPGTQDSVQVSGPSGTAVQTISGPGSVAAALFTGNTMLAGHFAAGTLTVGTAAAGGMLQLAAGTALQSGAVSLAAGSLQVNGAASSLTVAGTLILGDGQADGLSASLNVTGGGQADILSLLMDVANCEIYVDPASVLEVGSLGGAKAGYLTVDPGAMLSGEGDANAYGDVANNGTIAAVGGTLAVGTLSGAGTLMIGAGATLELNGPSGAGEKVQFAGANGVLDLQAEFYAPSGTVSGFAPGDSIDVAGSLISSAVFAATGTGGGVLSLYYGSQVAGQIALAGNFVGSTFLTAGDGSGGTLITVAPAESGGGTASPGTSAPDQYLWVGTGSGLWNAAANWQDQTTGADPAQVAPGVHNNVSIGASGGSFTVIGGPANAASLSVTGEVGLAGAFGIGALDIGLVSGVTFTNGALDLLPGATVAAGTATIAAGAISVAGSNSALSVGGTLVLGGGGAGVGLPVTALSVTAGGRVTAGSLVLGGGSGDSIVTDPTGTVEIGTAGGAKAGVVTVDRGASLTGNGTVNPLGAIVDNGRITAEGGILALGAVTGSGTLAIAAGTLELNFATGRPIQFTSASSTLALAGTGACPTGVLSGMVQGDVIDILGDTINDAQFNSNANSTGGTILLIYGDTLVGQLVVTGNFTQDQFVNVPDGNGGTLIELAPDSGGSGGAGQTGTDQLVWTGAQDGNWSNPSDWNDVTAGEVATEPPGAETPATMAGPTGTQYQSISGTGTCASLALSGNSYFQGDFSIGTLTFGQDPTATAPATGGTLVTYPWTTFTLGTAFIADGLIQPVANNVVFDVAGTLTLGDGGASPAMIVQDYAAVQAGALVLGGGTVSVDAFSSVEIGALGTGALGALTIDPGCVASGEGALNVGGLVTDDGTIAAQGGTLLVGDVSGTGSLTIGTEASLSLTAAETQPIIFAGAGATLILPGSDDGPAGVIEGFAAGDGILVSASSLGSVSYAPGPGGVGTLTLIEGGQVAGTLLLAGNYAGDSFAVAPDGTGTVITEAAGTSGAPAGTTTPDQYVWIGGHGPQWVNPANWDDTTRGQRPAAVPPGQNDLVTIAAAGNLQTVNGPADAALLTLTGTVALGGAVAAGTLAIGTAQQTGMLALGPGDAVAAGEALVLGSVAGGGGTLTVAGVLAVGAASGAAGIVEATGQTAISAGSVVLQGTGSVLMTDATATIEIGGDQGAAAGSVTVDGPGQLSGSGAVNVSGAIDDNGLIASSGGTLVLGAVSGDGTLLVGSSARLVLEGSASAGLTVDFAGAGTLVAGAGFAASVADFGPSDAIILPVSDATSAAYALEAPGVGVLTILNGSQVLQQLTLLGSTDNETFDVSDAAGGGTVLTASSANMAGIGGDTVQSYSLAAGGNTLSAEDLQTLAQDEFPYAAAFMQAMDDDQSAYLWYLENGEPSSSAGPPLFGGEDQPGGVDLELIAPGVVGDNAPTDYVLQNGYHALIAEGSEPVELFDNSVGDALLVGNANSNPLLPTIVETAMSNDTLVGAVGGNTLFWAQDLNGAGNVVIQGGGNDTMVTNQDNAAVTTSYGGRSLVFLGPSDNSVISQGTDAIVCTGIGNANDTVTAAGNPGLPGPTVFGPPGGKVVVNAGASSAIVVGGGGELYMDGGAGKGNVLWAGQSDAYYVGGAGSGAVVGGSGWLVVEGGSGPVTVYGGTGPDTFITNEAAGSVDVVGSNPTTISAGTGNAVYITGSAPVSVSGGIGLVVYAGQGTGDYVFNAGAGSETLWGGAANDQFIVGSGNDNMVSGGGADVFDFTYGKAGGSDIIYNFVPGKDTIALHGYGDIAPTLSVQSWSTYFNLSDGTRVEISGVTNLSASSFSMS